MLPHLWTETFGRAVYFGTYEFLKRRLLLWRANKDKEEESMTGSYDNIHSSSSSSSTTTISLPYRMLCAAASGITCWSVIFPMDVIRCQLLAAVPTHAPTAGQIARSIYQQHGGVRGFYRGFSVTVLRAGPVAAVVLPVYDMALEALSA
jgi:hypothetical protein